MADFMAAPKPSIFRRILASLGWTRHSYYLLSGFVLICGLIIYVWWPLAQEYLSYIDWGGAWWRTFDWLLIGNFLAMSLLIMAKADLRLDAKLVFVGTLGGLVIESWGTQTNLWFYYTTERPPLWIIPAWPIAALSTDRLARLLNHIFFNTKTQRFSHPSHAPRVSTIVYWFIFGGFYTYMLFFVAPTLDKSLTWMALLLCGLLIVSPTEPRKAILTFLAGAGLGYFLERWGTTRECWIYYTFQKPPFFAVLAHGMASVAFWRTGLLMEKILRRLNSKRQRPPHRSLTSVTDHRP
jgi:hypothetical protein